MSAAVMRNAAIAMGSQEKHLILESIRAQWPAVTEDNWLALAPIFEVDLRAVFRGDRIHLLTIPVPTVEI